MSEDTTVTENDGASEPAEPEQPSRPSTGVNRIVLVIVAVVFIALLVWKAMPDDSAAETSDGQTEASLTSVSNDAVADYAAARESGKPIYVLFHSLTCVPCVEISAVADEVVPEYGDTIVFVNAITDEESGYELSKRFSFQYIPTSFFIGPDGQVADSYTGAIDAVAMRARLDALVAGQH